MVSCFRCFSIFCSLYFASVSVAFAEPIDFDAMQAGHWYEIPNTELQDAFPDPAPPGNIGPKGVVRAWSGGAFDTTRERLILWGGGHADYSGNEIYVFDINASVPKWQRLTEPSMDVGGSEESGVYPDGLPRSRHTYNYIEYIPPADEFCSFGAGGTYPSAMISVSLMQCYDFSEGVWKSGERSDVPSGNRRGFAVYDPVTNDVWYRPAFSNGLYKYNPSTDNWSSKYGSDQWLKYGATAAVDTNRHNLVAIGNDQFYVWDLDSPGSGSTPSRSGATSIEGASAPGFQYDSNLDKFVAWSGGGDVYVLDPATWKWTRVSPAPTNTVVPPEALKNGTFGRFKYIPSKNAYILYNDHDQNVFIYKLSADGGVANWPTVDFFPSSSSIDAGESVTLSWSTTNATSCTADGGWSGAKAVGSDVQEIVGPIMTTTTYTLSCSGSSGTVRKSVTVSVGGTDSGGSGGDSGDTGSGDTGGGDSGSGSGDTVPGITATNPSDYNWATLTPGTDVYLDRSYTYTTIPTEYEGFDVLQTANDDKQSTINPFISFNIDSAATIYVAYYTGTDVPTWLSSWTDTGQTITDTSKTFHVFSMDFAAGTVTLGGNEGDLSSSNYVVFLDADGSGSGSGGTGDSGDSGGSSGTGGGGTSAGVTDGGSSGGGSGAVGLLGTLILALTAIFARCGAWSGLRQRSKRIGRNTLLLFFFSLAVACGGGGASESTGTDSGTDSGGSDTPSGGSSSVTISATSPSDYVWATLTAGTDVYIDRSYTYTSIPAVYEGFDVLQTANDDKQATIDPFISFNIDSAATIYVAYYADTGLPSWLASWTDTGRTITDSSKSFYIFSKDFAAGTVTLGGNEGDASSSNYVVFFDAAGTSDGGSGDSGDTGGSDGSGDSGDSGGSDGGSGGSGGSGGGGSALPVTITADSGSVTSGSTVTLNWSAPEADSCVASGAWSGSRATSGSATVGPLSSDSVFELTCTGEAGTGAAAAYVTVQTPLGSASLTTIDVQDSGTGSGRPVTVGVPLARGTLMPGETLVVTKADGTVLSSQWNALAEWRSDATALHGVVTFLTPDAGDNSGTYHIKAGTPFSGTAISKTDVVGAGFDATVEVQVSGTTYSLSASALLQGSIMPRQDYTHFTGPLASEFVVGGPLRANGTGSEHNTLQAYFYIRAFKRPVERVYATVVLENTGAFNALSDINAGSVDVTVGGVSLPGFPKSSFTVYADTRYQKRAWWNSDPNMWAVLDVEYVQDTKLVPDYREVTIDESTLAGFTQSTDWNERNVLSSSSINSGGAKPELAPYDRWTAAFLISGDRRAWNAMEAAQDEYAFMVSKSGLGLFRPRDEATGLPVDLAVKPVIGEIWGATGDPDTLLAHRSSVPQAQTDLAHQPAIGYVRYLFTGDANDLENLHFSAVAAWINERPGGYTGLIPNRRWGPDGPPRAIAWTFREILNAGTVTPEHHPLRSTMENAVSNALDQLNTRGRPIDSGDGTGLWLTGPGFGVAIVYSADQTPNPSDVGDRTGVAGWQNDWLTWSLGVAYERGWQTELDASGLWSWKAQAVVSRFGTSTSDYCWQYASVYALGVQDTNDGPLYTNWPQIFDKNWPGASTCAAAGAEFDGGDRSATDYGAQIGPALAQAVTTGIVGALDAWDIYDRRSTPKWEPNNSTFNSRPEWAIQPR